VIRIQDNGILYDVTDFWKADLSGQDSTIIYDINTLFYHLKNLIQKLF